jgi:hypothetical protein
MNFCDVFIEPGIGAKTLATPISTTKESLDLIQFCKCLCRGDLASAPVVERLRVEGVFVWTAKRGILAGELPQAT